LLTGRGPGSALLRPFNYKESGTSGFADPAWGVGLAILLKACPQKENTRGCPDEAGGARAPLGSRASRYNAIFVRGGIFFSSQNVFPAGSVFPGGMTPIFLEFAGGRARPAGGEPFGCKRNALCGRPVSLPGGPLSVAGDRSGCAGGTRPGCRKKAISAPIRPEPRNRCWPGHPEQVVGMRNGGALPGVCRPKSLCAGLAVRNRQ